MPAGTGTGTGTGTSTSTSISQLVPVWRQLATIQYGTSTGSVVQYRYFRTYVRRTRTVSVLSSKYATVFIQLPTSRLLEFIK
jgi:hypothetical protein